MVDSTPGVKSTEDIQRDMQQTREAITEKVSALENQVLGTIQTAADTVTNTVGAVKDAVSSTPAAVTATVDAVKQSVRETLDSLSVSACVRKNPWASLGASLFLGGLAGRLLSRRAGGVPVPLAVQYTEPRREPVASKPGLVDDLGAMVGKELRELAEQSLSTLIQSVKRSLGERVPEVVDAAMNRVTNRIQDIAPQNGRTAVSGS